MSACSCDTQLVIDAQSWVNHLPHTIEACFFVHPDDALLASTVCTALAQAFRLHKDQAPPVVRYDLGKAPLPFVLTAVT